MTIVLRADAMDATLRYPDAVHAVADAFLARFAEDPATAAAAERSTVRFSGGWLRILSGTLPSQDLVGFKAFHMTAGQNVRYLCSLYRLSSGEPLALLDANHLTVVRTAAAAAAAASRHWGDRPIRVGVVGSGIQAREGLRALSSVCTVVSCQVYSRSAGNRTRYATEMSRDLGIEVTTAGSVAEAARDVDYLLCATHSDGSVAVTQDDVGDVTYISSVGSTLPTQREIDHQIVARAARILVDTPDALEEAGDLLEAARAGVLDRARVTTMSAYLAADDVDRSGLTIYKSIGSVEQDLAVAGAAYRTAVAQRLGECVAAIESPKVV